MKPSTVWSGILLTLVLASGALMAADSGAQHPDFTGAWELDERMSEDPVEQAKKAMAELRSDWRSGSRGGGGGRGGGKGGSGGGRGTGRGDGADSNQGAMASRVTVLVGSGADRLAIAQDDPQVSITYSTDLTRTLYTDGRNVETKDARGEVKTTSKWKKTKLVVEAKSDLGKVTENYELEEGGNRLFVDVKVKPEGEMPSFTFRRTYNPADPAEAEPDLG